jgi:2-polyprenyl-3-methyl-5-hydroxy-6-metoxy-1,4-benzoquinol methylase
MSAKTKPSFTKKSPREMQPSVLRQSMIRKLPNRLTAKAELLLPAVPGFADHYVQGLTATWDSLGRHFTPAEVDYLRKVMGDTLKQAFDASPYSRVLVKYETDPPPKTSLTWQISIWHSTIESEYAEWVASRTPPLFGNHPDAKIIDLARSLGKPSEVALLDVGAGTGRNTLPLAREGFSIDAVELAPAFATLLRGDIEKEGLAARVFEGSILDGSLELPADHYHMIFLSEVVSHFRNVQQVRTLFQTAAQLLVSNGYLLFNSFTPLDGYKPDDLAHQMSEVMWCSVFSRHDLKEAASGLPLECVSDESTLEYERAHHPPEQWPPTGWYEAWTAGQDLFDLPASKSPVEMRWIAYRKTGG